MACDNRIDFCVKPGETFKKRFMWDDGTLVSTAITAITQAAPVQITAANHGLVTGWRAAVVSAKGMKAINSKNFPPLDDDWHVVTRVDANNVRFDTVNSADFSAYTSGGFLVYMQPYSLAGVTARMILRDAVESGTVLATFTSSPAAGITVSDATKVIEIEFETSLLTWQYAFYDLELTIPTGEIVEIASGTIFKQ